MPTKTGLPWLIFAQLVVTLALLGVVVLLNDGTTRDLVLGAVIAHWLSESKSLGQQVTDSIEVKRVANLGGGEGGLALTPATTSTTPEG